MIELEHDKRKKLTVVSILYLVSLSIIAFMYYSKTELDLEKFLLQLIKAPS